ncbi:MULTISPECIES: flagellar biosynthesis anti-sigma factor FlgM [Methylomonas]|uniref:flagellar biosynthesis anti-sigma factor FlgM n=1 Tax=Methylomonas TaxID=416 RepID=UPI001231EE51|nr:flagellar biosynthesis anti-sigma factor FlgM [Methylomonas rhizoryzae]
MAIQSINANAPINATATAKAATNKVNVESKEPSPGGVAEDDTVSLTSTAQDLKKAENVIAATPVVNDKKVADIKAALQAGTYQPDFERTAGKMLDFEAKLSKTT